VIDAKRRHQDRTGALLRAGRRADDGAPEGPAGVAGARARRRRRRAVLPEAHRRSGQDARRGPHGPGARPRTIRHDSIAGAEGLLSARSGTWSRSTARTRSASATTRRTASCSTSIRAKACHGSRCRKRPQLMRAFLLELGLPLPEDQRRQGPARGGADQAEARLGHRQGFLAGGRDPPGARPCRTASRPRAAPRTGSARSSSTTCATAAARPRSRLVGARAAGLGPPTLARVTALGNSDCATSATQSPQLYLHTGKRMRTNPLGAHGA
jgi:hypothetical protein